MAKAARQVVGSKAQNKKKGRQHQKRLAYFTRYKNEERHERGHIRKMVKHLTSRWGRGDQPALDRLALYNPILLGKMGVTPGFIDTTRKAIVAWRVQMNRSEVAKKGVAHGNR